MMVCAILSVVAHFAIARALEELPARKRVPPPRVDIKVVDAPRPQEPPKPPEPEPAAENPQPQPQPKPELQRTRPVKSAITATVPKDTPSTSTTAVTVESSGDDEPVYGVTMTSTSSSGSSTTPVGTTTLPGATGTGVASQSGGGEVVAAYETTKMPMPRGPCFGKYTDEAKVAGIEGTVVLDLTVSEDGRTRDIRVAQGLSHGLSETAVAALRDCSFSPGEKDGKRVPVRIRGFKIHFVLQEAR
jgi:protein TonB